MMKIRQISIHGILPFQDRVSVFLGPYFTLIKGNNGAGKTTILEALALLGHCNILDEWAGESTFKRNAFPTRPYIDYYLVFGKCPFSSDMLAKGSELQLLAEAWDECIKDQAPIILRILYKERRLNPLDDLKDDLSDEERLHSAWCIDIKGDEDHKLCNLIKRLIAFSRPNQEKSKKTASLEVLAKTRHDPSFSDEQIFDEIESSHPVYSRPPRANYLEKKEIKILPPFICYVNTDMYERGIGLDDRESPKRLTTELAELVLYRYHLGHNEGNFVRVVNFNEIQNFWNTIFCEKDVSKLDSITFTETDNNWIAKVEVYDGQFKTTRTFISSGENQVLALGLVCGALLPKNSLILLDEGDLHLSVSAGKLLYEELYNQAIDNDLQIIMVSHLSYLFPNNLHDDVFSDAEKDSEKALADFIEICESRKADGNDENKFVTSIFVKKDFDDVTVNDKKIQVLHPRFYYQGNAAEQAAKLQMADMEAVLAASRSDRPSFWITLKAWYLETNKWLKSGEFLHEFRREFNRLFVK